MIGILLYLRYMRMRASHSMQVIFYLASIGGLHARMMLLQVVDVCDGLLLATLRCYVHVQLMMQDFIRTCIAGQLLR